MKNKLVFGSKSSKSNLLRMKPDNSVLEIFLKEARDKYQKLSAEDEIEYFEKINAGDEKAKEEFIEKNLLLGFSIAKQFQNQGFSLLDLVQEASIGLIKAVGSFDITRGFKFSSHAVWCVRGVIKETLNKEAKIIRLPLNQMDAFNKIKKAIERFELENGFSPSEEEIFEITGVSPGDVMDVNNGFFYLDEPLESGTFCSEQFEDPDYCDLENQFSNSDKKLLEEEILKIRESSLMPKERVFIEELYFNQFLSEQDDTVLAREIGVAIPNVNKIRNRSFKKMKKVAIHSSIIMDYLNMN